MTVGFYRRYIPPAKPNHARSEGKAPPVKKRKRDDDLSHVESKTQVEDQSLNHTSSDQSGHAGSHPNGETSQEKRKSSENSGRSIDASSERLLEKRKKKKRNPEETQDENADNAPTQQLTNGNGSHAKSRHAALLSRYGAAKESVPAQTPDPAEEAANAADDHEKFQGLRPLPQPEQKEETAKVSLRSALPNWLQFPTTVSSSEITPFSELPLSQSVRANLKEKGHENAFAVQSAVLPMLLPGPRRPFGDLCVSAPTGSGKTLAYIIPMIESLKDRMNTRLRGLVVVPTRELVAQVRQTIDSCAKGLGVKVGTAVGSKTRREEHDLLIESYWRYDPAAYKLKQTEIPDDNSDLLDWDYDEIFRPKHRLSGVEGFVENFESRVDILVCTPGRLVEHVQSSKGFSLLHVEWLVIDEADRLLDETFQQWIDTVMPKLEELEKLSELMQRIYLASLRRQTRRVQKVVLSATMTNDLSKLASLKLVRPRLVVLRDQEHHEADHEANANAEDFQLPDKMNEIAISLPDIDTKPIRLVKYLDSINDETSARASPSLSQNGEVQGNHQNPSAATFGTLIFTNTNENALRLTKLISLLRPAWSHKIGSLTKSSASSRGRKVLNGLKSRKISLLVASDRASRGLDIEDLAHVVNYDMPTSLSGYVHRVGRTARAGKHGTAITLVGHHEGRWFWNEIARAKGLRRGDGKKVSRIDKLPKISDEEQEVYKKALQALEEAVKGIGERA